MAALKSALGRVASLGKSIIENANPFATRAVSSQPAVSPRLTSHHIVILGLDGVHTDVLQRLMKAGRLPALTRLRYRREHVAICYVVNISSLQFAFFLRFRCLMRPCRHPCVRSGTFTMRAKCNYPSISEPNWAACIYGTDPQSLEFYDVLETYPAFDHLEEKLQFESIFSLVKTYVPHSTTAAVYGWDLLRDILNPRFVDMDLAADLKLSHFDRDEWVVQQTVDLLQSDDPPTLLFAHIDNVDEEGHEVGILGQRYEDAIISSATSARCSCTSHQYHAVRCVRSWPRSPYRRTGSQ